jgi:hypothetical protein
LRSSQTPSDKPVPLHASDYLRPKAAWPLVYITDISQWAEDVSMSTGSFTLTHGARYSNEASTFNCKLPIDDADLFEKRGAYIVVLMPAESSDQVARVLKSARSQ